MALEKVCLLSGLLSPSAGGLAFCVPQLAWTLEAAKTCEVHVVGFEDANDLEASRNWGPRVHVLNGAGPRGFGYSRGIKATLAQLSPSVIDVQGLWSFRSLANLSNSRKRGTPYVVTPHGMLDPWARARSAARKRFVRLWFEDAHLAEAACLRATAQMEAEHFRSFGLANPIAVVPNGVQIPELINLPRGRGEKKRALFLSRIHPKKGLPYLLRAWAAIEAQRQNWELVIAGPDELNHRAEMQALAGRLGINSVIWQTAVQGTDKSALYRSADLFVLPTHAENFGLVVAEALAHEVPVITTRNAPWEDLHSQDCGWWIPLEVNALQRALEHATALTRDELDVMGTRGRRWMERDFGWEGIAEKMSTVYSCVVHGGRLPAALRFD